MKRWGWRAILFLALGALLNVAVAITIQFMGTFAVESTDLYDDQAASKGWPIPATGAWPAPNMWHSTTGFGYSHLAATETRFRTDMPGGQAYSVLREVIVQSCGWPFRTLKSTRVEDYTDGRVRHTPDVGIRFISWSVGIERVRLPAGANARYGKHVAYVPIMPVWPGCLLNVACYGALACTAFAVPGWLRGQLRRSKARCPHCAYPVGTSVVCTECGKPVKAKAVAPT